MKRGLFAAFLLLAAPLLWAGVPFWGAKEPVPFETPAADLKPGEFTWAPEASPAGSIMVLVSLEEQRAYVYRNGVMIGLTTVSTGKKGHVTPTGVFHTTLKDKDHHSSIYNNAPMPYTQRFTNDGIALHAGGLPGYPESHGCVHLPSAFAALLFADSPLGMTVVVSGDPEEPALRRHPAMLAPVAVDGENVAHHQLAADLEFEWNPERAAEGPLSILLSRADSRLVVLRNGIEIGRSRVHIRDADKPLGTHVLVASARTSAPKDSAEMPEWTGVAIVGHHEDAGFHPDPEAMNRIVLPPEFVGHLLPELASGTTLMVTDAPILEQTTGQQMTLLTSHPEA